MEGTVYLATFTVLLVAHIVLCWRSSLWVAARCLRLMADLKNGKSASTPSQATHDARHVKVYMDEKRLYRGKKGLWTMAGVFFITNIITVLYATLTDVNTEAELGAYLTRWLYVVANLIIMLGCLLEKRFTSGVMYAFYSLFMVMFLFSLASFLDKDPQSDLLTRSFIRIYLAIWVLEFRLVALWNTLYFVAASTVFILHPHEAYGADDAMGLILRELFILIMLFLFARDNVKNAWSECRMLVEQRVSRCERSATRTLLNAMCDVVVVLNEDLSIIEEAPKLAGMLLHGSGSPTLKGRALEFFMPAEDQDLFHSFITRPTQLEEGVAEILHCHMRDSWGNMLKVELIHAKYLDLDDRIGHLIGICEQEGRFSRGGSCHSVGVPDRVPDRSKYLQQLRKGIVPADTETSSSGSSQFGQSSPARSNSIALLSFNPLTYECVGRSHSMELLAGGFFPDAVAFFQVVRQGPDFLAWLQQSIQAAMYTQPRSLSLGGSKIAIRPDYMVALGLEFQADCYLELSLTPTEGDLDDKASDTESANQVMVDAAVAHLVFTNVKVRQISQRFPGGEHSSDPDLRNGLSGQADDDNGACMLHL